MTQDYFIIGLQELAQAVCEALVSYPDDLNAMVIRHVDHVRVYIFDFPRCDFGKLLGTKGTTLNALRVLFQTYGDVRNEKVELTIAEPIVDKPEIVVGDDPAWNYDKSETLGDMVAVMVVQATGDFTTPMRINDEAGVTQINVRSNKIDTKLATAISKLIRSAARQRGRKVEFRAEKI